MQLMATSTNHTMMIWLTCQPHASATPSQYKCKNEELVWGVKEWKYATWAMFLYGSNRWTRWRLDCHWWFLAVIRKLARPFGPIEKVRIYPEKSRFDCEYYAIIEKCRSYHILLLFLDKGQHKNQSIAFLYWHSSIIMTLRCRTKNECLFLHDWICTFIPSRNEAWLGIEWHWLRLCSRARIVMSCPNHSWNIPRPWKHFFS